jgi:hypothetical protein
MKIYRLNIHRPHGGTSVYWCRRKQEAALFFLLASRRAN